MNNFRKIFFISVIIILTCLKLISQENKYSLNIIISDDFKKSAKFSRYNREFTDSLSLKNELNNILIILQDEAYLNASFDSVLFNDTVVKAYLNPGNKYYWLNISFNRLDKTMLRRIGINERFFRNKSVYYNRYLTTTRKIVNWYENNGYPFISVYLDSISIINNNISAELKINLNNKILFDSLDVQGNINISDKFLRQYTGIQDGRLFNEKVVKDLSRKLEELPFLSEHRPFELEFTPEKAKAYLYLDKRKANSFNGIIALYQRDKYTGKPGLRGELNFKLYNSFGNGEKILLDWKKLESTSQKLSTEFNYPYIFSTPGGFALEFGLFKKDSTFININTKLNFQYLFSGNNSFYVFLKNTVSTVLSTPGSIITNNPLPDVNTTLYGTGIEYKKLDYIYNPKQGVIIIGSIGAGNKKYPGESNVSGKVENSSGTEKYIEVLADLAYYFPVAPKMTLKIRNLAGFKNADNLFENELFRIGGLKSIRGFEEESFLASSYNVTSLEYRYLFERNSAFYIFFDVGYYKRTENDLVINDTPFGFGVGVDFETRAGIFTLNYALGRQHGNPIEFNSGKVYFGLVNRF